MKRNPETIRIRSLTHKIHLEILFKISILVVYNSQHRDLTLTDSKQKFFDNLEEAYKEEIIVHKDLPKKSNFRMDTNEESPCISQIYSKKKNHDDSGYCSSNEEKHENIVQTNKGGKVRDKANKQNKDIVKKTVNLNENKVKTQKNVNFRLRESSDKAINRQEQTTPREEIQIGVDKNETIEAEIKNDISDSGLSKMIKDSSNKNLDTFINSNNQNNIKLLVEKNQNLASSKESFSEKKELAEKNGKNKEKKEKTIVNKQPEKNNLNNKDNVKDNVSPLRAKTKNTNQTTNNFKENPKTNYRNSYKEKTKTNDLISKQQKVKDEKKLKNNETNSIDDNEKKTEERQTVIVKNRSASVKMKGNANLQSKELH